MPGKGNNVSKENAKIAKEKAQRTLGKQGGKGNIASMYQGAQGFLLSDIRQARQVRTEARVRKGAVESLSC